MPLDVPIPGEFCDACGAPARTGPTTGNRTSLNVVEGVETMVHLCKEHWGQSPTITGRMATDRRIAARLKPATPIPVLNRFQAIFSEIEE